MWLLAIEIIMAIVAFARGWGFWPFGLIGGTFIIGLFLGPSATYDTLIFLSILDWLVTAIVTGMAIIGRNRSEGVHAASMRAAEISHAQIRRIKCPFCAELILPEAKICRYCGSQLDQVGEKSLGQQNVTSGEIGDSERSASNIEGEGDGKLLSM